MSPQEMLELRWHYADLCEEGADLSIRDYLKQLLTTLFEEGESFSGKRPWGNSGWENDLATPLVVGGAIAGTVDEYGYADDFKQDAVDTAIFEMIDAL
jgi:hypothetical protein